MDTSSFDTVKTAGDEHFSTSNGSPPSVIPPDHPFRTLVLCFDGTGDQFDSDNSNIVELFSMLPKADRTRQMVYYQAGIGTYTIPKIATPLMSKMSKALDEAIAWNMDAHVMGGYEFLMQNYTANDRICIFGFSRGAYTARSLAGMLHKVGLLPACNHQQIPFAYKMYTSTDDKGWKQSNAFKKTFSINVDIEFIGVWDTVNSVGLIPRRLPFTTSNMIVRTFRHAVALDERRAKFKVNLWNRSNEKEKLFSMFEQGNTQHTPAEQRAHPTRKKSQYPRDRPSDQTDIDEVWFAGCHCDVGGGSVENEVPHALARISLRWMIRECFKTKSGIMFNSDGLRKIGLDPASLYPLVAPRPLALPAGTACIQAIPTKTSESSVETERALLGDTEEAHELMDALSPIYDQLSLKWFWWILEWLPIRQRYQRSDNSWVKYFGWNMGKGRFIPRQKTRGVRVHRSVKTRMEAATDSGGKYEPRAKFDLERTTWVD
ncbi:hypothetical protein B0H15DRAFT_938288 [Mycena belliarum]|uniref:T6SS Phospholipase effector Tle1-like catalytic domain-containing protein n=1 Tax=Mycena belliarum TaxID=1033014 RepID=A0AAD6XQ06_9AGAR|nr:hypothetical protein B0H15DRAFT_938288 [Mycena belliae]